MSPAALFVGSSPQYRTHSAYQPKLRQQTTFCSRVAASNQRGLLPDWDSFASSTSGEWEGKSASFAPNGDPLPLPERYVPPEFGAWGLTVKDWGTLTSTKVTGQHYRSLTKFMFPTVGCESDAANFTEHVIEAESVGGDSAAPLRVFVAGADHSIGPSTLPTGGSSFSVDTCFYVAKERRVRVWHTFERFVEHKPFKLTKITLFSEDYTGPYMAGKNLPMCCGPEPGFSESPTLDRSAQAAIRSWRPSDGFAYKLDEDGCFAAVPATQDGAIPCHGCTDSVEPTCLPLNVWSKVTNGDDGSLVVEAGVVHADNAGASMSRRCYLGGHLQCVVVAKLAP